MEQLLGKNKRKKPIDWQKIEKNERNQFFMKELSKIITIKL